MASASIYDPYGGDEAAPLVENRFLDFLKNYQDAEEPVPEWDEMDHHSLLYNPSANKVYVSAVEGMRTHDMTTLFVDFAHVQEYDEALASTIASEFYRFEPVLRRAISELVRAVEPGYVQSDAQPKEFFVAFFNMGEQKRVRDLRMDKVGALVAFNGTVTRTSEVRPELLWGRFACGECGTVSAPVEQQFKYTEPTRCVRSDCNNRTAWKLDVSRSRFVDWQRVRVQENADEIPPGSMPRSVDVILRHGAVEKAKAGDKAFFAGTLIVIPDLAQLYRAGQVPTSRSAQQAQGSGAGAGAGGRAAGEGVTGMRALGVRDLTYRVAFLAQSVAKGSPTGIGAAASGAGGGPGGLEDENPDAEVVAQFTEEQKSEFVSMARSGAIYRDLVASLAPMIHGHTEIKKGLLLMLLGGVHKRSTEGVRLRGDINVCIVGDPSTAKSQFLKYATKFWPRSVYTSGKSASAAGLTASIAKDPDTGEFTIEAGALMLADNGICCIDEFDKMDAADQVAIHEAMEQQTISITKAGIQATLNARTSILAAANPIYGRYDPTRTLRQNINISAPIMSRFDLFFIVLDELDEGRDAAIAEHIVRVHQKKAVAVAEVPYSMERVLNYVRFARTINPRLSPASKRAVVRCYRKLREADALSVASSSYRVTVRQLESMIRLSEALARLHLDEEVSERYVLEAYGLIRKSMRRVDHGDVMLDDGGGAGGEDGGDGGEGGSGGGGGGDEFAGWGEGHVAQGLQAPVHEGETDPYGAMDEAGSGEQGPHAAEAPYSEARYGGGHVSSEGAGPMSPASARRGPRSAGGSASAARSGVGHAGDSEDAEYGMYAAERHTGGSGGVSSPRAGSAPPAGAGSALRGQRLSGSGQDSAGGSSASSSEGAPSYASRSAVDSASSGGAASSGAASSSSHVVRETNAATGRASVRMSFEKYAHIKMSLAMRLREKEDEDAAASASGASSSSSSSTSPSSAPPADAADAAAAAESAEVDAGTRQALQGAMRVRDLIAYYLEAHGQGLGSGEARRAETRLLRKVVARLIEGDRVLYYPIPGQATGTGTAVGGAAGGADEAAAGGGGGVRVEDRWVRLSEDVVVEGFDLPGL